MTAPRSGATIRSALSGASLAIARLDQHAHAWHTELVPQIVGVLLHRRHDGYTWLIDECTSPLLSHYQSVQKVEV